MSPQAMVSVAANGYKQKQPINIPCIGLLHDNNSYFTTITHLLEY